jgi:hypothetical protein
MQEEFERQLRARLIVQPEWAQSAGLRLGDPRLNAPAHRIQKTLRKQLKESEWEQGVQAKAKGTEAAKP